MKRNYTLLFFLLATVSILAQTPEKMSYQVVLRDASNTLLTNQQVGIQISILQTTSTGSAVYTETQTATTNINGLVSLEIGTGASSDDFSTIDWSAGPFFIKTATDASGGSNYSIIGTSQLMSVPFALYAKTAGNDELKENTANKSTNIVTDAASDVKFPSVKSVKTYVDAVQDDADANEIASTTSAAALQGYIDALEARITVLESASTGQTFYEDTDNDGYGDINSTIVASAAPNGYVSDNTDCNDTDAAINPATVWFIGVDTDGDTFFGSTTSLTQCESPGIGYLRAAPATLDCDDSLATGSSINPDAIEVSANGIDDNCDGQVDEATVGQLREGGIVFWVDPADNMHGKVCALEDAPMAFNWDMAILYSGNYTNLDTGTGVYSNWYLPSQDELRLMYTNLQRFGCSTNTTAGGVDASLCPTRKGNFSSTRYWNSKANDYYIEKWSQRFGDGYQHFYHKLVTFYVRAVRAF
jgi:hypothetical protein